MATHDGGPAFPRAHSDCVEDDEDGGCVPAQAGMSLRDWFAGQYLAGRSARDDGLDEFGEASHDAYRIADAMLKAREQS